MALATVNLYSEALQRIVTINAIIPVDNYSYKDEAIQGKKTYKTLYLLHGIVGNYTDWITNTRIMPWAEEKNLVVIMPSGDNRFYLDNFKSCELYGEFIGKELVDLTRRMFPLSEKREDTFIAGSSMGGYGAVRNGLKYSETFGYIAGLSTAFIMERILKSTYDAEFLIHRRNYLESAFGDIDQLIGSDKDYKALITTLKDKGVDIPKLYLACGTDDFLINENRDYRDFLIENQVDVTYVEGQGTHNWEFWNTYIKKVLEWLPLD